MYANLTGPHGCWPHPELGILFGRHCCTSRLSARAFRAGAQRLVIEPGHRLTHTTFLTVLGLSPGTMEAALTRVLEVVFVAPRGTG
jgi:hypothetical protein